MIDVVQLQGVLESVSGASRLQHLNQTAHTAARPTNEPQQKTATWNCIKALNGWVFCEGMVSQKAPIITTIRNKGLVEALWEGYGSSSR